MDGCLRQMHLSLPLRSRWLACPTPEMSEWYRPISEWKDQHDAAVPKPGMVWDGFPYLHVDGVFRANAAEEPCDIPATTWFR